MRQRAGLWSALAMVLALGAGGGYWLGRARATGVPASKPMVYSGILTDAAGVPISGSKNVQIAISNMDGSQKCGTDPSPKTLNGGAFSVELPDACTTLVHQIPDLWIEVFVDGTSLGKTKMGAVPYAVEADHAASATKASAADTATMAVQATAAAGALDTRLIAVEAHGVSTFAEGYVPCHPLGTSYQAGYTNVLVRANLFSDEKCTTPANDSCHPWCASQLLRDPTHFDTRCCGVTYYTNGVVETILYK